VRLDLDTTCVEPDEARLVRRACLSQNEAERQQP
jgi:hypothetical protein